MAMRIAPVPHFWGEVKFSMIGDLDQSVEVSLKVKYRLLEQQAYEDLLGRVHAGRLAAIRGATGLEPEPQPQDGAAAAPQPITDREVVDMVMLDWDDVLGDDDQKLPFTKDNLERALGALGCRAAIVRKFFEVHAKELEKNFAPRPATTSGT